MNAIGEREEALNPFTSVERVVSDGSRKKKEEQQQRVRGQSDKSVSFDQKAPSFQKRNQDLGGENDVNDGYLFVRYVSMKPKITIWKSLGFLFLEIGLAIAFISGYTMMGKGVHVYDFLNKDAHSRRRVVHRGELFRSVFSFVVARCGCYFKARTEKDDEIEGGARGRQQ